MFTISSHIGLVYAGIGPDVNSIIKKLRKDCLTYDQVYRDRIPVFMLAKEAASLMQEYTVKGGFRPFGCSLLIAGVDHEGPKVFRVDPSGVFNAWKAAAIGKNMESASDFLEKRYEDDLELEDAVHVALLTMKEGYEGEMSESNIEIGIVNESDKTFKVLSEGEVKDYLKEAS